MFRVELQNLSIACQHISPLMTEMNRSLEGIESIIRELKTMTVMDEVIASLRKDGTLLSEEKRGMLLMMEALDSAITTYETTENRIVMNAEGIVIIGKKPGLSVVDVSKVDLPVYDIIKPEIVEFKE